MTQAEETITVIISNAERLLNDAIILKDAGSYRTSMALSILALEEVGKACLVKWKADGYISRDIIKDIRSGHVSKQRILGVYHWAKAIKDVVDNQKNKKLSQGQLEKLARKKSHKASIYTIHRAETGLYDGMKQMGFYTDIDDDLTVLDLQRDFKASDANFHISEAKEALGIIEASPIMHQVMADLYEGGEVHQFSKKRPNIFRDFLRDESRLLKSKRTGLASKDKDVGK